jgi:hypothetical protein
MFAFNPFNICGFRVLKLLTRKTDTERATEVLRHPAAQSSMRFKSGGKPLLAQVYGFTDLDGTSPDVWQHMEDAEKQAN